MSSKKTLVIVESPSKCKKIEQYLGSSYKVIASCGHFTKLDSLDQISFDTFQINYKIDKGKVLKSIKDEIKKSKEVILATDDDREGEAIAWSLCLFCKLDIQKTKKMVFQEITKPALLHAIQHLTTIHMDRVRSQQARQILDIYLGYTISPMLWKYVQHTLSAGRCQTPSLSLIYDNQKEIDSLSLDTHFKCKVHLTEKYIPFQCTKPIPNPDIHSFMDELIKKKTWSVDTKKERQFKEKPPTILITSTLQQKAHSHFRYSPKLTMKYAQELYENGFITYMRTDSACYSKDVIQCLSKHIKKHHGDNYIRSDIETLSLNKNKNKAQEAHEGIRVCDLEVHESNVKTNAANTLYKFIYKHTVQCGMSDAVYHETVFGVSFKERSCEFRHVDKNCIFRGWTILDHISANASISFVSYLTLLYDAKTCFSLYYAQAEETCVEQKSHYHEASLIQKLESMGIGRPSTYASILANIIDKKYVIKGNIDGVKMDVSTYIFTKDKGLEQKTETKMVHQEKQKLSITPLGKQVCEFCYTHFHDLFQYDFTRQMENELDDIEHSTKEQKTVLSQYIQVVDRLIQETNENYQRNPDQIQKVKDQSIHCGVIQGNPWYIKNGMYGYYLCIGKKDHISLKEFEGFSVEQKINSNTPLQKIEQKQLIEYVETRATLRKQSMCVILTENYSIRESKYGYYLYYKTKKMKKPTFYKYNDERDEKREERNRWVIDKNKKEIVSYLTKKYNITI